MNFILNIKSCLCMSDCLPCCIIMRLPERSKTGGETSHKHTTGGHVLFLQQIRNISRLPKNKSPAYSI